MLNLGDMPPEDERQPPEDERARVIAQLTQQIAIARIELKGTGGHSVLRRLNSWEYRQTIGDLLGLNVEVWNPAEEFPEEIKVHGFDNNGAGLVTSGRLMDHYFAAAEEALVGPRSLAPGQSPKSTRRKRRSISRARMPRICPSCS